MKLRRLLKIVMAGFLGQGVSIIGQLLVPPFFLRYYTHGVSAYGEWVALSASVTYLGMLNYGIQTYANNEMTIRYNAGDKTQAKVIQASALRLLLGVTGLFVVAGLVVFLLPISNWLNLHQVTPFGARLTLYLLILQITTSMLFTLVANSFMMLGHPYYSNYWQSGQRLFLAFAMSIAIYLRAPFSVLAAIQLSSIILFTILVIVQMRITNPILTPSLRYGTWKDTLAIVKPSSHFGLISLGGFLTWIMPVILIQRILGSEATGIFALVRVVFQMSRQILMIASTAISQDITEMWGRKDWRQLRRLYDMSERLVLFLIPLVTVGTLLLCPLLFTVWLHKRNLYEPEFCFIMAVISGVLGIKEHKTTFQSSSNEHAKLSWIIVIGYSVMLVFASIAMKFFGLMGYLISWLVWESIQTVMVLRLNENLFPAEHRVSSRPLMKMGLFTVAAFSFASYPALLEQRLSLLSGVALAIGVSLAMALAAFHVFGLREVVKLLQSRMVGREASIQ